MSERYLIVLFDKRSVFISKEQADVIKQALKQGAQFVEVKGNLYKTSAIAGIERQKSGVQKESDQLFLPKPTEKPVTKETLDRIKMLKSKFTQSIQSFPTLTEFEKGQVRAEEEVLKRNAVNEEEGSYVDSQTGEKIYS